MTWTAMATASPAIADERDYGRRGLMGFRYSRRKSIGKGWWIGMSKSGPSIGRRGKRTSVSYGSRGASMSIGLLKGLSYVIRRK